jgi:hypothetical protein
MLRVLEAVKRKDPVCMPTFGPTGCEVEGVGITFRNPQWKFEVKWGFCNKICME